MPRWRGACNSGIPAARYSLAQVQRLFATTMIDQPRAFKAPAIFRRRFAWPSPVPASHASSTERFWGIPPPAPLSKPAELALLGQAMDRAPRQELVEIGDGLLKPFAQFDFRPPAENGGRLRNVGLALLRVVGRRGGKSDPGFGPGDRDDRFGQFEDGEFVRVADVDRPGHLVRRSHHAPHGFDRLAHKAEGARLAAVAIDGDVLSSQRLDDEIRHDAS